MKTLILDGAFGTMAQALRLGPESYALPGRKAAAGCNDVLCLTRPEAVKGIHQQYLQAGADIITTNSFNANAISLSDYGLQDMAYDIARAAAEIACQAVAETPGCHARVAGSMGPTNRTLSMSPDVNAPERRDITFDQLYEAYRTQAQGLLDGGADIILIETAFDTLNAKAAIKAVRDISPDIPLKISATVSDASGRLLSGQTVEAMCLSVLHARPMSIGLNCGFGAKHLLPYLRRLRQVCPVPVSVHPNAGLPNIEGGYDETPEMFAADLSQYLREGLADIVGGCCGTTPAHIAALSNAVKEHGSTATESDIKDIVKTPACQPIADDAATILTGLEPLRIEPQACFVNVGERTNVAGSAKFARLIREDKYAEALQIAREQVVAGAQIVDICMDDALIDGRAAMSRFINLIASEPEIARVPLMIDSSHWPTILAGLQRTQGKSVVNSISLKEGEETFLQHARTIRDYGAAAVVMLFDENGQADTYQRKIEVAERAYKLLIGIGFPAQDIIFDPNILAVATGMPQHDRYARDFIDATRWIKQNLPGSKVSGGVSNLSFAFRGNNLVRKAMHAAFLYHAIAAGMDMGIVNPQMVLPYSDIPATLLEAVEDVILYRRPDATDRLIAIANQIQAEEAEKKNADHPLNKGATSGEAAVAATPAERLQQALLKGDGSTVAEDAVAAIATAGSAIAVISDVLMPAMERVGALFGQGKLFLPQVVKSARTMKQAVDALTPYMPVAQDADDKAKAKVVLATVKGDVHDIGKNIVGVVLACNGYKVIDLGVMTEAPDIIAAAMQHGAAAIGLSGLITPSLEQMTHVAEEAERQGCRVPIIIGGATTSPLHTAVKIALATSAPVLHARDAADTARLVNALVGDDTGIALIAENAVAQQRLREQWRDTIHASADPKAASALEAALQQAGEVEEFDAEITDVESAINWSFFFSAWGIPGRFPEIFDHPQRGVEARKLYDDAKEMLQYLADNRALQLKGVKAKTPAGTLFALTAGLGVAEEAERYHAQGDDYKAFMVKLLADRLAEAMAETYLPGDRRLAVGYPALPDHSLKRDIFRALDAERTGMRLTETCMISPGESICGILI